MEKYPKKLCEKGWIGIGIKYWNDSDGREEKAGRELLQHMTREKEYKSSRT